MQLLAILPLLIVFATAGPSRAAPITVTYNVTGGFLLIDGIPSAQPLSQFQITYSGGDTTIGGALSGGPTTLLNAVNLFPDSSPNGSFSAGVATFADSGVMTFGFSNGVPIVQPVPGFTGLFQNGTVLRLEGIVVFNGASAVPFEAEWIGQEASRSLPEPSGTGLMLTGLAAASLWLGWRARGD